MCYSSQLYLNRIILSMCFSICMQIDYSATVGKVVRILLEFFFSLTPTVFKQTVFVLL